MRVRAGPVHMIVIEVVIFITLGRLVIIRKLRNRCLTSVLLPMLREPSIGSLVHHEILSLDQHQVAQEWSEEQ